MLAISAHMLYNLIKERVFGAQMENQDNTYKQVAQALELLQSASASFSYSEFSAFHRHRASVLGAIRLLRLAQRVLRKTAPQGFCDF